MPLLMQDDHLVGSIPERDGALHDYTFSMQPNDVALRLTRSHCFDFESVNGSHWIPVRTLQPCPRPFGKKSSACGCVAAQSRFETRKGCLQSHAACPQIIPARHAETWNERRSDGHGVPFQALPTDGAGAPMGLPSRSTDSEI